MSIFTKQVLSSSFPAYDVFVREADGTGYVNITAADTLGLCTGKGSYRTYSPGSVVSYALEYNECPIAAVERVRAQMLAQPYSGHKLHWINQDSTCISDSLQARKTLVRVVPGMQVRFEGWLFTIGAAPNNNLAFYPI